MRKIAIAMLCLGLAACGGEEKADTEGMAVENAAKSAAPAAPAAPMAPMERAEETAMPAAENPDVRGCLDLVRDGQFAQAVPVCLRAVSVDPDNEEVQKALDTAKAKAVSVPGSAGEAAGGAEEAAQGALGDVGKKLP